MCIVTLWFISQMATAAGIGPGVSRNQELHLNPPPGLQFLPSSVTSQDLPQETGSGAKAGLESRCSSTGTQTSQQILTHMSTFTCPEQKLFLPLPWPSQSSAPGSVPSPSAFSALKRLTPFLEPASQGRLSASA